MSAPITIALPKGRIYESSVHFFANQGIDLSMKEREYISYDRKHQIRAIMVRNTDLPRYVHNGIAGMGIVGTDILTEFEYSFFNLATLPFGNARICLAGKENILPVEKRIKIATKYPRFTYNLFHTRCIPVEILPLHGSVELAPLLGLAPYIVDLVETGNTLKANNLSIVEELIKTKVVFVANRSFYKVHYRVVDNLIRMLFFHD